MKVNADLCHCTTDSEEKGKLLIKHLHHDTRTRPAMPTSITCVSAFCDESLFSVPPESAGLVSIVVQGYVQTQHATVPSTMKKWIDSATLEPVPGGLTSINEYLTNMSRFNDPTDSITRLIPASLDASGQTRTAEGRARQVNENYHILTLPIVSSNGLCHVILSFEFPSLSVFN